MLGPLVSPDKANLHSLAKQLNLSVGADGSFDRGTFLFALVACGHVDDAMACNLLALLVKMDLCAMLPSGRVLVTSSLTVSESRCGS